MPRFPAAPAAQLLKCKPRYNHPRRCCEERKDRFEDTPGAEQRRLSVTQRLMFTCLYPLLEIRRRNNFQISTHPVVSQTAQLSTCNLVLADFRRRKAYRNLHSGNHVLLNSQFANVETVNYVLRTQNK